MIHKLSKRAVVLHKHPDQQSEHFIYFELTPDEGERTDGYYMTKEDWEDFGRPSTLTIIIKPGDHLNVDEAARLKEQ